MGTERVEGFIFFGWPMNDSVAERMQSHYIYLKIEVVDRVRGGSYYDNRLILEYTGDSSIADLNGIAIKSN